MDTKTKTRIVATMLATGPAAAAAQVGDDGLEELVVTSSLIATPRRQIGTAVSVVDGDEIELRGYHSLADVLRTVPGIGVSNSGGAGKPTALRIRGEEHYRTMLIVDGVKVSDPSAPQVAPSFESLLATSDLARVEVLRGPQGFIHGADAGGVVNVLTRVGEGGVGGRLGLERGGFDTRKLDASVAGGGAAGDYHVSVTDVGTDGFNAQTADTILMDDDGAENTTLHAKLGWNATESLRLQLVMRDIDATASYDGCFSSVTFAPTHDCVGTTEQTTYRLSADLDSGRLRNVFGVSGIDVARDDLADGAGAFATDGEVARLEYTGSFEASERATFVYGLDMQSEKVTSGDLLERDQQGYYVEYQGAFGDGFFLSVGGRRDDNDDFGTHTSARLSAAYVQDLAGGRSIKYRASHGTGFRSPSLYEVAYNRGPFAFPPAAGAMLGEESSRGYDLGIEYRADDDLQIEVTYFDQRIEDEIFFDLTGFSGYLQSPGESSSKGVEIGARIRLGAAWSLQGNWTNNTTRDTANDQRLRRPENLGNIGASYRSADGRLRFIANYRVSMDAVGIGGVGLEDYSVLDLSLAYSIAERLEVYARVENAADEDYQEILNFNAAGRGAYAGARLRF